MTEYIKIPKEEYEKLLYFKRRYDEQNKIHHEVVKEMQNEIDQLERNCDVFNEQMNNAVERTVELNKEKQDLKEWLEEIRNKPVALFPETQEQAEEVGKIKFCIEVLERLG